MSLNNKKVTIPHQTITIKQPNQPGFERVTANKRPIGLIHIFFNIKNRSVLIIRLSLKQKKSIVWDISIIIANKMASFISSLLQKYKYKCFIIYSYTYLC